ncbi:hypothetical protein [Phytohabitans houttuyneae]|uniref:Uncharacterized protein n=1 Tax=Phytohabitans houttuyneae TaxID=1076126 RepID=A0A6V8KEC9_9ACTN|nr:hypothetical protein [Phytohabitans houttuyneae]GFJ82174.1 hypothetical protein Phou_063540 [Phytohabitans houttuyneae]
MSVVSRTVPSVPVRTSVETWDAIVESLTAPDQAARTSLETITNVAAMLIAEEYTRDAPIVVMPASGDRVRIYTAHGTAAIESEDEPPLATWPLADPGWRLSLPCGIDDIDDVRAALQPYPFVEVRDVTDGIAVTAASTPHAAGSISINYDELERS